MNSIKSATRARVAPGKESKREKAAQARAHHRRELEAQINAKAAILDNDDAGWVDLGHENISSSSKHSFYLGYGPSTDSKFSNPPLYHESTGDSYTADFCLSAGPGHADSRNVEHYVDERPIEDLYNNQYIIVARTETVQCPDGDCRHQHDCSEFHRGNSASAEHAPEHHIGDDPWSPAATMMSIKVDTHLAGAWDVQDHDDADAHTWSFSYLRGQ